MDHVKLMELEKKNPKCVRECQRRLRDRIEICNDLFNSKGSPYCRNTKWHNTCLLNARTEFDNCMSTCE